MSKKILDKIKSNKTRQAEIDGESVNVRVYSFKELQDIGKKLSSTDDKEVAEALADQFLNEDGTKVFTPEFFMSDECPNVAITELSDVFVQVNCGTYKKK